MKRLLFLFVSLMAFAMTSFAQNEMTIVCADDNIGEAVDGQLAWSHDPFSFVALKNNGASAPTYNTNGKDVRTYAKNTLTVSASAKMTQVVFKLSNQGLKRLAPITVDKGEVAEQAAGDATVTWTGNATEVTFTVGEKADFGSDGSSKAGQLCFESVTISYGEVMSEYSYLEYLEKVVDRRENCIKTDYVPNVNTTIKLGAMGTQNNGWAAIFSARNVHAGSGISLYKNGDNVHFGFFTGGTTGAGDGFADFEMNKYYDIEANTAYLKLKKEGDEDWWTKETGNTEMNPTDRTLAFFANPEWDASFQGRIYYASIEDGETTYTLKPVIRHADGVLGLLDEVSGKFFTPAENNMKEYRYGKLEGQQYVELDKTSILMKEGDNVTITATGADSYEWSTDNAEVATVADGVVTGVAAGTCTITCKADNWVLTVAVEVTPATVPVENKEYWDGQNDIILGSIKHNGDAYRPAYTWEANSHMGYSDQYFNHVFGVPSNDKDGNAWYAAEYTMTNDDVDAWTYNSNILPNGWSGDMGDVYVRRYFTVAEGTALPEAVYMPAPHDDAPCEYYLNGTLIWARNGYEPGVNGWNEDEVVKLTDEQIALLKTDGSVNVFAYHVHQNWGGRYADGGLYKGGQPRDWFENDGNRRALTVAVAQAETVEGVDPEVLAYAKNATVCRQDAGRALDLIRFELKKALAPRYEYAAASAEPADGMEVYFYNVATGQFLAGNNDWGTHASVTAPIASWPMVLHANTSGENRFSIQTNLPNGRRGGNDGLGHNGYVDCGYGDDFTTNEGWAWTFEANEDGTYSIIQSGRENDGNRFLGVREDARYQVDTDCPANDKGYNSWKLITPAQLEALYEAATTKAPANVTYKIKQNDFSQNDFEGNEKNDVNLQDANNDAWRNTPWERNAGSVWNWKGNDANGDYVFEAWNSRNGEDGKIYLKQTINELKPGYYVVGCSGYYRDGNWESAARDGNAAQLAYLYAGTEDNNVALKSILDCKGLGAGYGRMETENIIPDGCRDAAKFFQYGQYKNEIGVLVGEDGVLELGVYRMDEGAREFDWVVVDNFTLTYYGKPNIPANLYIRHDGHWGGDAMTEAEDSEPLNKHFVWKGYTGTNVNDGAIFNFTAVEGGGGDACWGPQAKTYVQPGQTVEDFGNYGDNCYVFQNQTAYVQVDVYCSMAGNKVTFTDYTLEAMAEKDAIYVVGENTTGWSRSSEVCQKLEKVEDGVYEGVVTVTRDNTIFDAIRFATVADNGDDDNYIGLQFTHPFVNSTYKMIASNSGRVYLRKGDVKVKVDFNNGTITTENVEVAPSYVYAVGTLVDANWQNTNTKYTLNEVEPGVFQGVVAVAEDGDSRFSLFAERTSDDWNTGRMGPNNEGVRPEAGVPCDEAIVLGHDKAWRVPAGEWLVTLNLNNGTFTYEEEVIPTPNFVSVDPEDGAIITDANQVWTVTFDGPVNVDPNYSGIGVLMVSGVPTKIWTEDQATWFFAIDHENTAAWEEYFGGAITTFDELLAYGKDLVLQVAATDMKGNPLAGNDPYGDEGTYTFAYHFGEPAPLVITPADGTTVDQLDKINFSCEDGLAVMNWDDDVIIKKDGEVVLTLDAAECWQPVFDAEDWWAPINSYDLVLSETLTEPGTYTVELPENLFWVGMAESMTEAFTLTYKIDVPSGINGVDADDNTAVYTIGGVRTKASAKGIVIKNGKKFVNK